MIKLKIEGGNRLRGVIRVDSSKNALLHILAASVLVDGKVVLNDVPHIIDIENILHLLSSLGCTVERKGDVVCLDPSKITGNEINPALAKETRGSIFLLGSLLGRFKTAKVAYPGGCAIGNRPIDLHIQGLRDLGVRVQERGGAVICNAKKATGGDVYLDFPSVGATENLIFSAVLGKNKTRIINAAKEPEVVDVCNFLNNCGACISGAGTSTVTVEGVERLHGCTYTAIPDRIITGSYLLAVAACGGSVTLTNTVAAHNESLLTKLAKSGCSVRCFDDKIHIESKERGASLISIQTSPYPGFPTDLQSQIAVYQAVSRGVSTVTENLFESRFKYVPELLKMGAKITVRDRTAIISGVERLIAGDSLNGQPLEVDATDLRGGVALVLAALCATGVTVINNADYIYRGHQAIETDLASVGANIIRIDN